MTNSLKINSTMKVKVTQPRPHVWILQARILEWVAFPFSRGSSQPRNQTRVYCIAGGFFASWATREAPNSTIDKIKKRRRRRRRKTNHGSQLRKEQCINFVLGFPLSSVSKESACNADLGLIPGSERSPGEGNGNPLQYSCLENPMDRGAWQPISIGSQELDTTEHKLCPMEGSIY